MKKQLRGEVIQARTALDDNTLKSKSKVICDKFWNLEEFQKAQNIMAYISFRNEVDVSFLFDKLWSMGKKVIIPVCDPKEIAINPSLLLNMESDLQSGTWGILEPKPEAFRPVDPQDIDFVIVPGVAFDTKCNRLGYGGGFYDRFLPGLKKGTPKVAAAFQLQIVNNLIPGEYDIPMDFVITEEKEYQR